MIGSLLRRLMSPRVLVFAPVIALSMIVAIALAWILLNGEVRPAPDGWAVSIGIVAYTVLAVLAVRFAIMRIGVLEQLGFTDSLSGLPNRRALHLDAMRLRRQDEEIALALIDLDGFKLVNDQYGHFVGDRLIKQSGQLLGELCAEEARCYRLGGDEFAILVIGPLAGNILESLCRRLLERLTRPVEIDERELSIGASIGLSRVNPREPHSSSEMLRQADVAMYASKAGGKMRCTWFKPEFDRCREVNQHLESELRDALASDQFQVAYQPLVDAKTGEIAAVEALVRWQKPDGSFVSPNLFIPVAEESGLINPIGRWVLRRACTDALAWEGIKLSVNVSAAQLRNSDFPVQLGHILEETGFPPERLELEVTETYLVGDPLIAGRSLDVIRGFGVGVALDDFGTGYASIGFLRKFRFEKLKIDRSLIVDAADDEGSRAMMVSSIAVARAMEMAVTAEGVETIAQADMVRAAGCDQIQGWLYYKAISAEEISNHLLTKIEDTGAHHGNVATA